MMTPARFTDYLAGLPRDRMVVVDLDDDVDAIAVPGDVVARVEHIYEEGERDAVYQLIALLIVRLGSDTAVPTVRRWIDAEPGILRDFPPETLRQLASDPEALGPILGRFDA
jgi:hypothetical protein